MSDSMKRQFCGESVNITTEYVQTNCPTSGDYEIWLRCDTCNDENLPCETFFAIDDGTVEA